MGTGNTTVRNWTPKTAPVHPRGHGEHVIEIIRGLISAGSSPWARGTPVYRVLAASRWRFIPVGTGNTFNSPAGTRTHSVHPRGHGEHFSEKAVFAFVYGSSPWARGTPSIMPNLLSFERFIPVGTGNTPQRSKCVILPSVHPRGHGEHS